MSVLTDLGDTYRIFYDDSCPARTKDKDAWAEIRGKHGTMYMFDARNAIVDLKKNHNKAKNGIEAMKGATLYRDSDEGPSYVIHLGTKNAQNRVLRSICRVIGARRKRQCNPTWLHKARTE